MESQVWEGCSLTASDPSSGPQGANILINDSGEVKLGEWTPGVHRELMEVGEGIDTYYFYLCLQLTLASQHRLGQPWPDASLSLGHHTGEGCWVNSWGGNSGISHFGSLGHPDSALSY